MYTHRSSITIDFSCKCRRICYNKVVYVVFCYDVCNVLSWLFFRNLVVILCRLTFVMIYLFCGFLKILNFYIIVICNYYSIVIIFILSQTLVIKVDCCLLLLWKIYSLLSLLRLVDLVLLTDTLINASFILLNRCFMKIDCLFLTFQTAFQSLYWLLMSYNALIW